MRKTGRFLSLLLFFIIFSSVFFSASVYDSYQMPKAIPLIFAAILIFLFLPGVKRGIKVNPVLIVFLVYFFYMVFKILASSYNPGFIYTLTLLSPVMFVVPLFVRINIKKFLVFINILVFLSCIYGILQFSGGIARPYSFFGNPIFFGEFLLIQSPFILVSFFYFEENRMLFLVNILLVLTCVIMSSSRGVFISGIISSAILVFYLKQNNFLSLKGLRNTKFYLLFIAVFFTAILFMPGFLKVLKYNVKRSMDVFSLKSHAVQNRMLMLKSSVSMIKEKPVFGRGAGSFKYFYQKYQAEILNKKEGYNFISTSYAHNDYFQMAVETGLAGLGLFWFFVFSMIIYYDRNSHSSGDSRFIFSLALLTSVTAVIIESFFNFPLLILPSAMFFWLYSGIVCSLMAENDDKTFFLRPAKTGFAAVLILVPLFLILFVKPFDFIANFYLKHALILDRKNDYRNEAYFEKALRYNPENFYTNFYLGDSYSKSLKTDKAVKQYRKALEIYPFSADMLYNTGVLYFFSKNYKEAEKYLRKSLNLYPGFARAHLALGKAYMELKMEKEAVSEFSKAQHARPGILEDDVAGSVLFFHEVTFDKDKGLY